MLSIEDLNEVKMFFFFFSILFFLGLWFLLNKMVYFLEFDLLTLNGSSILMTFFFDWKTFIFSSFVFFISSMVIFYSCDYMHGEAGFDRFFMMVVLFVFSMMFLIVSPNLISILLGWDGLGLVSYCLVVYYQNVKSYNAGMLTALSNRVGDVALLISIGWMINFGGWSYVFYMNELKDDFFMGLITMLIVLAAMTKSAQIPFSAWLPAAMAAPTPVSSLVHSSTLVTAGVYLIIRFSPCINESLFNFCFMFLFFTMFMAGLGANFEYDLKKIIALSTLSQLGLMMSIISLGGLDLGFFHLLTHALFKALLFMSAGMLIHGLGGFQDIRFMGSLIVSMPLTGSLMNISNLSLCGLPFLSGFYSKDLIIEFMGMGYINFFMYIVYFVSVGLTVCYSLRLTYYLNWGNFNYVSLNYLGESSFKMIIGMMGLLIMVVFMGSLLNWVIFEVPYIIILPFNLKIMTLVFILLGGLIGYEVSYLRLVYLNKSFNWYYSSKFFGSMWFMPVIFTLGVNYYPLFVGMKYYNDVDQGWGEKLGGRGLAGKLIINSKFLNFVLSNNIKIYILLMVFWLIFVFIMF
uniref:NADH-ubiquinone oxidoreductase chain 5 n=1 Tax=Ciidae sp. GENSP01 TaxID=1205545 RepID=A0A0S2MS28_9CUCU|nr:NADH deshydrogenase subunit 5 [Ciidae sp. GENSP01]